MLFIILKINKDILNESSNYPNNENNQFGKNQSTDLQIDEACNGDLAVKMYQKSLLKECKLKDC